MEMTILFPSIN